MKPVTKRRYSMLITMKSGQTEADMLKALQIDNEGLSEHEEDIPTMTTSW